MSARRATTEEWFVMNPVEYPPRRTASVYSLPAFVRQIANRTAAAKDPLLYELHQHLDALGQFNDNWDGQGSVAPDAEAIGKARAFLEDVFFQTLAEAAYEPEDRESAGWQRPHISASEEGEVVLEWWNGDRKLTVYIGADQASFIKSWGPHVVNDMEDGGLSHDGFAALWSWLFE